MFQETAVSPFLQDVPTESSRKSPALLAQALMLLVDIAALSTA
jgi:hypothetical protein